MWVIHWMEPGLDVWERLVLLLLDPLLVVPAPVLLVGAAHLQMEAARV